MKLLRENKIVDYVYDATIAYYPTIPQNESSIYTGFPKGIFILFLIIIKTILIECHIHFKKIDINSIPQDEVEVGEWLRDRWYHKDTLLDYFYSHNHFPE